ncbi:hypothetical protein E2562_016601 [Oryza meyeriana var. granulata]|uniref:Protein kinase domain-containing protein n=1 Tax=Oryza meyeriana var. granulata TaxID=110450 RepID=A0A6G1C5Y9_9ORYZ|nr:hypothetical protein E2562_016601 [Oryza meyeriana var. granulata]
MFDRLVADGHVEAVASGPELLARLEAHFDRLPVSYQLDLDVDQAEDVLIHEKVLAEAKDPARRAAFDVRYLRLEEIDVDATTNFDAPKDAVDVDDTLCTRSGASYTPIHEVVFSTSNKPKLLSQLSAMLSDIGLNIREAHVFSTTDGYSLHVFVVDGWPVKVVKVADFGLARFQYQEEIMTAETGTYRWMAPEVISHEPYNNKADVYSFSIVLWELMTSKIPYKDLSPLQAAVGVRQGLRPQLPENAHPRLLNLMQRCWQAVASHRPSFSDIITELEDIQTQAQGTSGETSYKQKDDPLSKD